MARQVLELAALLNFLRTPAPQAQAPNIQNLMLPIPHRSIERGQERRYMDDAAEQAGQVFGQPATPEMQDMGPPTREGLMNPEPTGGITPGTGVYDQTVPAAQKLHMLNQRMLESGNPLFQRQALANMGGMQTAMMKPSTSTYSTAAKMASELGYKPGTEPWNKFITDYASKKQFADPLDEPFGTTELTKWMTPQGKSVTFGTPRMAQEGKLILRNAMPKEGAGTTAMIDTALKYVDTIKNNMYDADGNINKRAIQDMFVKDVATDLPLGTIGDVISNSMMSPKGQLVSNAFEFGIQGITRIETGAAMPDEELGNTRSRFIPRPLEDDAVSNQKVEAYVYFLKNAKQLIRPLMVEGTNYKGEDGYLNQEGVAIVNQAIDKAFLETAPGSKPGGREWSEGDGPEPGLWWAD